MLSIYFVGQNVYHYMMLPVEENPAPRMPEVDKWKEFWEMFDKFQHYLYVSVIGFVVFYFLRKSNN